MTAYELPKTIYWQTIWYIREYPEIKERLKDMIEEGMSCSYDIRVNIGRVSDPTYNKMLKREHMAKKIRIIDEALQKIPEEYRKEIFNNIVYGDQFSIYASRSTYARHKQKFVYFVAVSSGIYEEGIS